MNAVRECFARIAASGRPELWIALREEDDALAAAAAVQARVAAGELLPLAGLTLAVKDNIDVAGLPTTAGCPAFAYTPAETAPAVARLEAAGAIVVGKTNLDQFATGLVGTRSPYGAVADARRPDRVAGGSSSGSAVAVALGLVDLALGTDTAGSGRVPAAFGGIVGLKATRGLVPIRGVVPACRTLDCVTVLAGDLGLAARAMAVMSGPDARDPLSRGWPADAPCAAPPRPRVGVPSAAGLSALTDAARAAFAAAVSRLAAAPPRRAAATPTARPETGGCDVVEVDIAPLLDAGRLLYEGAFVAERYSAVGAFVDAHPGAVDPTVGAIIRAASAPAAHTLLTDTETLDGLGSRAHALFAGLDALLLPTTTRQPTLAEVAEEPVAANARLGVYTNAANLLDLCGVAVPAGAADGGQFGVTVLAPAFHDAVAADVAAGLAGAGARPPAVWGPPGVELFVVGAHRTGQPLNHELTSRGARYLDTLRTAPEYRFFALDTQPPKPGLVRATGDGAAIEGQRWRLSPAALGTFLAALASPMALTAVRLEDGTTCVGFTCEALALQGAEDITADGSWPAYLTRCSQLVRPA